MFIIYIRIVLTNGASKSEPKKLVYVPLINSKYFGIKCSATRLHLFIYNISMNTSIIVLLYMNPCHYIYITNHYDNRCSSAYQLIMSIQSK